MISMNKFRFLLIVVVGFSILTTYLFIPSVIHCPSDTGLQKEDDLEISLDKAPPLLQPLASRTLGPPGKSPPDEELERLWNYVYNLQYTCKESEYLGGTELLGDGAYDLCVEKRFWPKGHKKDYKCLMYSFGVGNDFSFDDEIAKKGCEVHSFDPSIKLEDGTVRSTGVHYHRIGISDEDQDHGINGWKMRTLRTLLKELGHRNSYLDYLKVDTDKPDDSGFEEFVLQELLDTDLYKCVRQFAMEVHMPGILSEKKWLHRYRYMYSLVDELCQKGWRLYNTTDNVRGFQVTIDPKYSQRRAKKEQLDGKTTHILWEVAFVNFNVKSDCSKYLH